MTFKIFKNTVLLFVLVLISCASKSKTNLEENVEILNQVQDDIALSLVKELRVGANQTELYLPLLKGKKIGIVANQTSVIFKAEGFTHVVDSLLDLNINIQKVFPPEHGFRGKADAGELIKDGVDIKSGLPIISIYGKNKKPSAKQLEGIDLVVFDIQDVGVRFYTYISTLHYVMEACAEQNIPLLLLDRPNPIGQYIDGPILEPKHKSFVGLHTIPVVHGMTIGEYAQMINGEGWLANTVQCELTVIPLKNYTHSSTYNLPIKPSPNLPNDKAINLYPSLCFFEGTNVSAGRGTEKQFQIFGSPFLPEGDFSFTPQPNEGSKYPKHNGVLCYGKNLTDSKNLNFINLEWLIDAFHTTENKGDFFIDYFTNLAGTKTLQAQIEQGLNADDIRATWKSGLEDYKAMRSKYLLYKD